MVKEGPPFPYGVSHFTGEDVAALGYQGVIAVMGGDTTRANTIIMRLDSLGRPFLLGANKHWQARIAAKLGQCERTVDLLEVALKEGSTYVDGNGSITEIPQFASLDCPAYKAFFSRSSRVRVSPQIGEKLSVGFFEQLVQRNRQSG